MKKYHLALLMILPLALFAISGFLRWHEYQLLNPQVDKREAISQLKQRALHPDKELDPHARITQLSQILINVDAAADDIAKGIAQTYRGFIGVLEGLALLQLGLAIYLFWRLKAPNRTVNPDAHKSNARGSP